MKTTAILNKETIFQRLIAILTNLKKDFGFKDLHNALILWYGENALGLDPDDIKERIVEDSHAEGVDSILVGEELSQLYFVQAKTVQSFSKTNNNYSETDIKSILEGIRFLLTANYKGRITPELENLVDEYHALDETGQYRTEVLILTLKAPPVDDKYFKSFKKDFPGIKIRFISFDDICDFYSNDYLIRTARPPEKISFRVLSAVMKRNRPRKSHVFTAKAKDLARIYDDYREAIFQQNIRYSLGKRKKSINDEIYKTATDKRRCVDFWYFNNGINIICKKIQPSASGKVINLRAAQIINGAQTTYAIYEAYQAGKLRDSLKILVKVTQSSDSNFIENVTLFTNSQNAIKLRDLMSNDNIQKKIQKILLASSRYFYEKKRGEFNSLYPTLEAKKKVVGPKFRQRVISNEKAAQAFLALYLNKPAQAKSQKGRIFLKDGGFYSEIFINNDTVLAEKLFLSWNLLFYINRKKEEFYKKYKVAVDLERKEATKALTKSELKYKEEIFKYDFLLHGEYYILNIFNDALSEICGWNIDNKREDILEIISSLQSDDAIIEGIYQSIVSEMEKIISSIRKQSNYYHNKFFKNEKSIAIIRKDLNNAYDYISVLE